MYYPNKHILEPKNNEVQIFHGGEISNKMENTQYLNNSKIHSKNRIKHYCNTNQFISQNHKICIPVTYQAKKGQKDL